MFDSAQLLLGGWPSPSFLLFSIARCALEPMSHVRERHLLAATAMYMDPHSLWELLFSAAHGVSTQWGSTIWKRDRAAGQEGSLRATVCGAVSVPGMTLTTTLHRAAEEQIPAHQTLHLCSVHRGRQSKSRLCFSSCPRASPVLPDLSTACFATALSPRFLHLKVMVMCKVLKKMETMKSK